jgi:hypothetical protein
MDHSSGACALLAIEARELAARQHVQTTFLLSTIHAARRESPAAALRVVPGTS